MKKLGTGRSITLPRIFCTRHFTCNTFKFTIHGKYIRSHPTTTLFNVNKNAWSWSVSYNLRGILGIVRVSCFVYHGEYSGLVVVSKFIARSKISGSHLGFFWPHHPTVVGKTIGFFIIPCGQWFMESCNGSGWWVFLVGFIWNNWFLPANQFHWIVRSITSKAIPIICQWLNFHVYVSKHRILGPCQWWNCNIYKIIYIHLFVLCKYIGIFINTTIENNITIFLVGVHVDLRIIHNVLQFKKLLPE